MIHQYDALVQKDSPFQTYVALQIGFVQPMPLATCALSSAIPSLSQASELPTDEWQSRTAEWDPKDMISKLFFGKPTKLYLNQVLFACRIRTHRTTKTSTFYLLYGKQPHLPVIQIRLSPLMQTMREPIRIISSARQEAAWAKYKQAAKARDIRNRPMRRKKGTGCLFVMKSRKNLKANGFRPYEITQRMLLGTYWLQDPNGRELPALVVSY